MNLDHPRACRHAIGNRFDATMLWPELENIEMFEMNSRLFQLEMKVYFEISSLQKLGVIRRLFCEI